jgi:molybdopterin molybdotransferase
MPKGSDTLIPIEYIAEKDGYISIIDKQNFQKGFSIRDIGENYKKGDLLISKDTLLDFTHIGVLASLNISFVSVYKKPMVSILSTGSEILDVGDIQTNKAQIRSSNHFTIEAIARKYGANTTQMGVVKDDFALIKSKIEEALSSSDIVVTTGGVSVGDYDFVKDIIKESLQAKLIFQGVHIKPGQHIILAQKDNKFILGLPGFAYSSTVTALLYLVPLIKLLQNQSSSLDIRSAILDEDFIKRSKKSEFSVANIEYLDGDYKVNFKDKKVGSSAILTNMLGSIALVKTDENDANKKAGEKVEVIIL